ncbi:sigma-54-dependent transcriptional regulator [Desulfosarcina cetonica]|uniref:sigma-54-dependent transcriptional regulator n=1 Tax=Desulfosarcina cetonica TaxID=90730 RepID=UPI0006D0ADB9|nr:sigma 54-interacting transcriptional regulator [Desulfosarcina cetonica]
MTAVVLEKNKADRDDIRTRLSNCGVLPICFQDKWVCLENIHCIKPSFAVLRSDSPGAVAGFVNGVMAIENGLPIIVLSSNDDAETFIQNNWQANLAVLSYPADNQAFQAAIDRFSQTWRNAGEPILIGGSVERRKLIQELPRLNTMQDPILIQGEVGVGKKLMARTIHRLSMNPGSTFSLVDATTLSGTWIQDTRNRINSSRAKQTSWYAIDNIEKLPSDIQSQLLVLLDNDSFHGNTPNGRTNRFISMTTREMAPLIQSGSFRKDLYHRLSALKLIIPPLRGYASDIIAMAEYFATQYSIRQRGMICRLTEQVMDSFRNYHWPGNIAELKRSIKRLILTDSRHWKDLLPEPHNGEKHGCTETASVCGIDTNEIRQFLKCNWRVTLKQACAHYAERVEKSILKAALTQTHGNCKQAAGLLDISYKSMLNKAKAYRLV